MAHQPAAKTIEFCILAAYEIVKLLSQGLFDPDKLVIRDRPLFDAVIQLSPDCFVSGFLQVQFAIHAGRAASAVQDIVPTSR